MRLRKAIDYSYKKHRAKLSIDVTMETKMMNLINHIA